MKLTIGMSCYDDFDGVWFTIQSICLYHPEVLNDVRFIVVDGNSDGDHGKEVERLVARLRNKHGQCGLYVKNVSWASTASRDYVFQYAETPYVLCVDSHVMIAPGAIKKLIEHYDKNPTCKDLIQGPIMDDSGNIMATSMSPEWSYNMYGKWKYEPEKLKTQQPYNIEMMGLGLFSCTKEHWQGFNRGFTGFGGEEGYIHHKFRKNGGNTICFPWLKWLHRFPRPAGTRYRNEYMDRINNYFIGWHELGLDTQEIIDYFSSPNELDGQQREAISIEKLQLLDKKWSIEQQLSDINK